MNIAFVNSLDSVFFALTMNKFLVVIIKIGIDYERVRKRCFQCQKLTHDKASCPSFLLPVYDKDMDDVAVPVISAEKGKAIDSNNKSTQMVTPSSSKLLVDAFKSGKNYLHSLEIRGYNLESLPGMSFLAFSSSLRVH